MSNAGLTTAATVPHGGPGTHTLVVAVEIDDQVLADPSRWREVLDDLASRAQAVLRAHHPAPEPAPPEAAGCRWCDADAIDGLDACHVHLPHHVGCRQHRRAARGCMACTATIRRRTTPTRKAA